jgi:iron complex transport system ATP-binding protein
VSGLRAASELGAASGATLDIRNIDVAYGTREILHDVSASIRGGEMVALIGPNGAGKSTILRCVSGLVQPRRGEVTIDGEPVADIGRSRLARSLAVVPGQTIVAFPMRVDELVGLGRIPHEHPLLGQRDADRRAVDAALARVGIEHLRERDVRELSLGERQLAVLAMAMAQEARLLLLDEPTVHLDLRHQVAVMGLLRDLAHHDGVTVLSVMHDIALVRKFFDRLVLLDHGRIVAGGPPAEVLTPANVRDVYGVEPSLVLAG